MLARINAVHEMVMAVEVVRENVLFWLCRWTVPEVGDSGTVLVFLLRLGARCRVPSRTVGCNVLFSFGKHVFVPDEHFKNSST